MQPINSPPNEVISFLKQSRATSKWLVPSLFSMEVSTVDFFFRFNLLTSKKHDVKDCYSDRKESVETFDSQMKIKLVKHRRA